MLNNCTALIIAGTPPDTADLSDLALQAGFGATLTTEDSVPPSAEVGPITFFILHSRTPLDQMRSVVKALRRSADINLRFAPVIVAGPDLTQMQTRHFASEGFDDIISLPIDPTPARSRLEEQLARTNYYYETADYLGPDRRRYTNREQTAASAYVLYNVWRDPLTGIRTRATRIAGKPQFVPALPAWLRG